MPGRPVILYFKSLQNSTTVCMTLAELASVFDVVFRVSLPSILRFQLWCMFCRVCCQLICLFVVCRSLVGMDLTLSTRLKSWWEMLKYSRSALRLSSFVILCHSPPQWNNYIVPARFDPRWNACKFFDFLARKCEIVFLRLLRNFSTSLVSGQDEIFRRPLTYSFCTPIVDDFHWHNRLIRLSEKSFVS